MKIDAVNPSSLSHSPKGSSPHHDSSFFTELISKAAEAADINPRIAVLVASHESGLNPAALNPASGAIGMMQLMPATAAGLGVNPHSVVENILGGVKYLGQQLATFGDTAKALAAYNWGPHHVSQAIERWGESWLEHAPAETRQYVNSIISQAGITSSESLHSGPARLSAATVIPSGPAGVASKSESPLLTAGDCGFSKRFWTPICCQEARHFPAATTEPFQGFAGHGSRLPPLEIPRRRYSHIPTATAAVLIFTGRLSQSLTQSTTS